MFVDISVQALGSSRAYRLLQNSLLAGPAWRCSWTSHVRLEVSVQALGSFCVYRLCCTPFQRGQPGAVRGHLTSDCRSQFRPLALSVFTDSVVLHSSGASLALFVDISRPTGGLSSGPWLFLCLQTLLYSIPAGPAWRCSWRPHRSHGRSEA